MSIEFITGKPGAGKSLVGYTDLFNFLAKTNYLVVTNLAVKWPETNVLLQKRFPNVTVDLHRRLHIIPDEEVKRFYLYRRPKGEPLLEYTQDDKGHIDKVDYAPAADLPPVAYFLDEVHLFFNARKWQSLGLSVSYYMSQHRKLGDMVFCITQYPEQVEKSFRELSQCYRHITNSAKRRIHGFALPRLFTSTTFSDVPKRAIAARLPHEERVRFRLDDELADGYDTAAGVGIRGKIADTQERAKGRSLLWLVPIGAVALFVIAQIPSVVASGLAKFSGAAQKSTVASQRTIAGVDTNAPLPSIADGVGHLVQVADLNAPPPPAAGPSEGVDAERGPSSPIVGFVRRGRTAKIYLANGKVYTERDPNLKWISGRGESKAVIGDQVHEMAVTRFNGPTNVFVGRGQPLVISAGRRQVMTDERSGPPPGDAYTQLPADLEALQ